MTRAAVSPGVNAAGLPERSLLMVFDWSMRIRRPWHGIELVVVSLPEAKRGFVLLPRRWVEERSFAWATRFRRLAKDDERLPETVAGLHFLAFACLMLHKLLLPASASP
jgi:transposase